jgi:hypothetical protein
MAVASTVLRTTATSMATTLRTTYTTPLLAAFVSGGTIRSSDINLLSNFITAVYAHTHTLQEYTSIDEYGNTGSTVGPTTRTTTAPIETAFTAVTTTAGTNIALSHYSPLAVAANAMISHYHQFTDAIS